MARGNASTVRRLWEVFASEGPEGMLELVPDDVEWQPRLAEGRSLLGTRDALQFWSDLVERGERVEADLREIEEVGENAVIATGTLRHTSPRGTTTEEELAWLFCFRDGRLWRASAHASAADALEVARFAGTHETPRRPRATDFLAEVDGEGVLHVRGELDLSSVDALTAAVGEVPPGGRLQIDLSELRFIDSSGLREFLRLARAADSDGWTLELVPAPPHVQRVFDLAGIERVLPFV